MSTSKTIALKKIQEWAEEGGGKPINLHFLLIQKKCY